MSKSTAGPPPLLRAEIDLKALRHNLDQARRFADGARIMAAVKANAYGHGVNIIVPALREAGVEGFGVASAREGAELRELGVKEPILVFGELVREHLPAYHEFELDATVGSPESVELAHSATAQLRVHVKVDTGMHRLGLVPEDAARGVDRLRESPHASLAGIWTHLATSDEPDLRFARRQIEIFDAFRTGAGLTEIDDHVANSGALIQLREASDGRAWVRPGGLLYGLPTTEIIAAKSSMKPVLRLVSRVVRVQQVAAGDSVSYGRSWRAEVPTVIATIAAGYGDGFPRALSNRGHVAIGGRQYPIAGRVCMDMLMVNLGRPDGPGRSVRPGDEVVLTGHDGPSAFEQARAANLLSYELSTGLTERVQRYAIDVRD